jgi:hypothetical protein
MKIVRCILAVILGAILANATIFLMHAVSEMIFAPPPELKAEFAKVQSGGEMDRDKVRELIQTMPLGALLMVVLAWEMGAFVGGAASAVIAGWKRLVFAGVSGAAVLAGTILNIMMIPGHPDWMIIAGLLLPLPVSLIAGKLVSILLDAPPPSQAEINP